MIMWMRLAFAVWMVGLLSGCATSQPKAPSSAVDDGYFLTFQQKGQLIGQGRIQDAQENWYDVWIVPGYVPPMVRAGKYMERAGDAFAEYGGAQKYHDLSRYSSRVFDWAYDDCLDHFIGRDLPRALDRYWHQAAQRAEKRVFGWWFAYPWATLESLVDPVVRVPLGACGSVLGSVWGGVAVPGYYMVDSAGKGLWHFTANGLVVPTLACTWNTVIAPPMSLVGQKPAPSRVDGFWVTMVSPGEDARQERLEKPVTDEELRELIAWGKVLLNESRPYEEQRLLVRKETEKLVAAAYANQQTNLNALAIAEKTQLRAAGDDPDKSKVLLDLQAHGMDAGVISKAYQRLREKLDADTSLSGPERSRIQQLLQQYPPATFNQATAVPLRPRTDPVENSIRGFQQMK
jgi:hypothetical protein